MVSLADTCSACGLCVAICPVQIPKHDGAGGISLRPDRQQFCMECGQCMAVCPSESITAGSLAYERDFSALPVGPASDLSFFDLLQTRRSVRVFKDQAVPKQLLERVVDAIALAPPGFTPIKTEVVVVQDTAMIRQALPEMIRLYEYLIASMRNPVARFFIRRKTGASTYSAMAHHAIPLMENRLPELKQGVEDTITRGAPAMLVFHADRNAENYETDIHIALTYGLLAAHALGLGATAVDLVAQAIEHDSVLRGMFAIPDDHGVAGAMILGYPKHSYQRGIKRQLKNVTWI